MKLLHIKQGAFVIWTARFYAIKMSKMFKPRLNFTIERKSFNQR